MVPLPKRRHSTRRGGKRKAAISIPVLRLMKCPNCQQLKRPHRVCTHCGYYHGVLVQKKEKKVKKPKNK